MRFAGGTRSGHHAPLPLPSPVSRQSSEVTAPVHGLELNLDSTFPSPHPFHSVPSRNHCHSIYNADKSSLLIQLRDCTKVTIRLHLNSFGATNKKECMLYSLYSSLNVTMFALYMLYTSHISLVFGKNCFDLRSFILKSYFY